MGRSGDGRSRRTSRRIDGASHQIPHRPGWSRIGARCYIIPDIFAVEACVTLANLLDKRSRFAPSTHSLLAVCPIPWLLAPVMASEPTPRWRATGLLRHEPVLPFVLPVRDIRVLFALTDKNYSGFMKHQLPHAHEYYAPMETLMAWESEKNPELQALLARATASANFIAPPAAG